MKLNTAIAIAKNAANRSNDELDEAKELLEDWIHNTSYGPNSVIVQGRAGYLSDIRNELIDRQLKKAQAHGEDDTVYVCPLCQENHFLDTDADMLDTCEPVEVDDGSIIIWHCQNLTGEHDTVCRGPVAIHLETVDGGFWFIPDDRNV